VINIIDLPSNIYQLTTRELAWRCSKSLKVFPNFPGNPRYLAGYCSLGLCPGLPTRTRAIWYLVAAPSSIRRSSRTSKTIHEKFHQEKSLRLSDANWCYDRLYRTSHQLWITTRSPIPSHWGPGIFGGEASVAEKPPCRLDYHSPR